MSHVIIGETTTGIISLMPNITQEDINKHDEKMLLKNSNDSKKVRRAFSMPRNPFRLSIRKSNKIMERDSHNNGVIDKHNTTTTADVINQSDEINYNSQQQQKEFGSKKRLFRRSSLRKFITRIAQQMTSVNLGAKQTDTDRVPPLGGYVWPPDQTPGVTGLRNHGNTCFMNAVLQCLSHTDILAEYFVLDLYKADLKKRNKINSRKFGTKGELTEQLALVLKALWTCKYDPEHSTSFKAVVDRYGSQFRSSTQHDAQEFLFWLLDKVHEDLNTANKRKYKTIKNSYGRPDEVIAAETLANHIRCNNSFVQAVFQAQFRSSLSCPRCHKQSNTFDPFHCISVQLPQIGYQSTFVTVLYATQHPKQVKLGLGVPLGSPIAALKEQLEADTGIKLEKMILAEINETGFSRVFCDSHSLSSIIEADPIYCIETPSISEDIRNIVLCVTNINRNDSVTKRFGTPFCLEVSRDVSYVELQKILLKGLSSIIKPETFAYTTPLNEMFKIRLQDPSADPDTYLNKNVEHPLFTEMIDLALLVLPADAGPPHVKLILEWSDPELFFNDMSDNIVEHESVSQLKERYSDISSLTLEQCLEHYTKAETLSAEDAWRCPHCQQYLPVVKTLGLWSLPDILVIHFKRFRQQQLKGPQSAKLTTMVKFPTHGFDMSPHLARSLNTDVLESEDSIDTADDNWSPWKKPRRKDSSLPRYLKDNRYDLYAVCYHQGETLETGHYTAACKNPYDHQWYKFDDQRITHVLDEAIPDDIVNNEAYILFYQRRKLDNMDCSGTSSTSMDHWVSKIGVNSVPASSASSVAGGDFCEKKTEDKIKEVILEVPIALEEKIENDEFTPVIIIETKTNTNNINEQTNIPLESENESNRENEEIRQKIEAVIENHVSIEEIPTMFEMEDVEPVKCDADTIEKPFYSELVNEEIITVKPFDIQVFMKNDVSNKLNDDKLNKIFEEDTIEEIPDRNINFSCLNNSLMKLNNIKFSEIVSNHAKNLEYNRRTICSPSSYRDCDTIKMIRGSGSSCSKDTLLYIDQQSHSLIDDDESMLGNRSHWISPVTPHKLITVSPKN